MKLVSKPLLAGLVSLTLLGVACGGGSSSTQAAQKLEDVTASWLPIMQTTAYYVALEESLFEKAGIKINSVKFENPNQIVDSLVSGQADFGAPGAAAGISMLAEAKFPGTLKVFGLQGGGIKVDRINDALIVKKGSSVKSFKDLRGKKLGTVPGVQWKTIARHLLRLNGLDPDKDVEVVELAVGLQAPAVVAGTVDATLSLEPVGTLAVASGEAERAMVNPVSMFISDPIYSGAAVLTAKFIKERPETARKVVEVIDEATRLVNADFDRYKSVIPKYTAIAQAQLGLLAQPYLRGFDDLSEEDRKSYQSFVDVFLAEGVLEKRIDVGTKLLKMSDFGG